MGYSRLEPRAGKPACVVPREERSSNASDLLDTKMVSCQVGMVFFHSIVIHSATGGECLPKGSAERRI